VVKALACELPADTGLPLAKWSCPDLAAEATRRGVVASVSASTVRRWLAADAIKPWQHRSWIFPRDPDFAVKAGRVLDLYARFFDGDPLGPDEYVPSVDEKPGVQARHRIHPRAIVKMPSSPKCSQSWSSTPVICWATIAASSPTPISSEDFRLRMKWTPTKYSPATMVLAPSRLSGNPHVSKASGQGSHDR
jgi:hypothetical protein